MNAPASGISNKVKDFYTALQAESKKKPRYEVIRDFERWVFPLLGEAPTLTEEEVELLLSG